MITRKQVRALFDSVEGKYRRCWTTLLKLRRLEDFQAEDLISFQPLLAEALFDVDKMYRTLHQEKRHLVGRKQKLSAKWFRERMRLIDYYQKVLKDLISVGRMLGDSFAWMFYVNERTYLVEHYKHAGQRHTPPGIGGLGELSFIRGMSVINDHMVIYHGTTTFLRLGDVSFIDLRGHKLKAIGELKSKRVAENQIQVSLVAVSSEREQLEFMQQAMEQQDIPIDDGDDREVELLSHSIRDKLRKQVSKIGKSMRRQPDSHPVDFKMDSPVETLVDLWKVLKQQPAAVAKAGEGLLLAGIRGRGRSLFRRCFALQYANVMEVLEDLPERAIEIIKVGSEHNRLIISPILNPTENYSLERGMSPLYVWPIPSEMVEDIIFGNVILVSIYNPAHLVERMVEDGFTVESIEGMPDFKVSRRLEERSIQVRSFSYFIDLAARHFFPDQVIFDMMLQTLTLAKKHEGENAAGLAIELYIQQHFGSGPPIESVKREPDQGDEELHD